MFMRDIGLWFSYVFVSLWANKMRWSASSSLSSWSLCEGLVLSSLNMWWDSPVKSAAPGLSSWEDISLLLMLLGRFSRVRLYVTPWTAAHQAPPSLGFSRQEHWSGLPFPSPMHESESEVTQSCPTLPDPMNCRLLHPWDFPGKSTGVGCHRLLHFITNSIYLLARGLLRFYISFWVRLIICVFLEIFPSLKLSNLLT